MIPGATPTWMILPACCSHPAPDDRQSVSIRQWREAICDATVRKRELLPESSPDMQWRGVRISQRKPPTLRIGAARSRILRNGSIENCAL
jgi:hypothetical protein